MRVTRADWTDAARAVLATSGVDQVRVLALADQLGVARSSFYWYFDSREALLAELLEAWAAQNTASIVARAKREAPSIAAAVLGVFECWADPALFDPRLDAAVRDWARRDATVARKVTVADDARLVALSRMFDRHGFGRDAAVRARVLYYTQIGYYALGVEETTEDRFGQARAYVRALTGSDATTRELSAFARFLRTTGATIPHPGERS
ncbi:MAG: TetR/AcrR family transcriptional regulator [Ilumatobacteraceae bacterium]|nr:TetR/AcrR family transcriptional regulator [Ilumatobacteraceae bacterium]